MEKKKVIDYIWKIGKYLQDGANKLLKENGLLGFIEVKGKPCWQVFSIHENGGFTDLEIKSYLQQEILKAGYLWYGQHNISFSHTKKDFEGLLKTYSVIFQNLKKLLDSKTLKENIEGGLITNVFKVR
jgi:hypothetical protein